MKLAKVLLAAALTTGTTYYVTWPGPAKQPLVIYDVDPLHALLNALNPTVWTEQQWKDCKPCQDFEKSQKAQPK